MRRWLWLLGICCGAAASAAQDGDRVVFTSADGVELVGTFHPAAAKKPCVLLLHGPGAKRSARVWGPVQERLAREGYAVLSFDFRGHGQSTTVDADLFWRQPANRSGIRGARGEEIQADNFNDRYLPVLVNDIAAAKALLDRKNDAGECNSANLIVIGADEGATLGAVWLQAECCRHRQHPAAVFGALPQLEATPEVQHVLCALWLNIEPRLGARELALPRLLDAAVRRYRVPMVFLYDADSDRHERTAQGLERALKNPRLPYTGARKIATGGAARAEEMLWRADAQTQLVEYLDTVVEAQADEWQDFDARQAQYVWRGPRLPRLAPANRPGSNTLLFQTYEAFLSP
jgi:pimeloyl-ACP methyl ester carboxylesterase